MSLRSKWFYFAMFNFVIGIYFLHNAKKASINYQPTDDASDINFVLMNTLEGSLGRLLLLVGGIILLVVTYFAVRDSRIQRLNRHRSTAEPSATTRRRRQQRSRQPFHQPPTPAA